MGVKATPCRADNSARSCLPAELNRPIIDGFARVRDSRKNFREFEDVKS
jgi:hypothetical protein